MGPHEGLSFLRSPPFETLSFRPLRVVTLMVLFLLLGYCQTSGKLQAVSLRVAFQGDVLSLSYLPELVTKTESKCDPLPRLFLVRSLA